MKTILIATLVAAGLASPVLAGGNHCADDLKAVDAAMTTAKLSAGDMAKVKAARAKADELNKAKQDEACEKAIGEAQKLLGITDTHKH